MDRSNHYEVAFEAYLQTQKLCYVAVDETHRVVQDEVPLKNPDFLVFGPGDARLVVDIKGRRFPAGPASKPRRVWECWSFRDDINGLERWSELAGPGYRGLLVFAYRLMDGSELTADVPDFFLHRGKRYIFRAVDVVAHREHMRPRSPSWDTVNLPRNLYRSLVRPFRDFTHPRIPEEVPF